MRVKYAKDIIKEIQARGSIQVPEGYITGEAFEEWLEGKESFEMSISEQVKELRETAELFDKIDDGRRMLLQAADTIEALSAKLAAANMERSDRYYGGGWIPCEDRLPESYTEIVLVCLKNGAVSVAINTTDGNFVNMMVGASRQKFRNFPEHNPVIAWQPLPEPYCP